MKVIIRSYSRYKKIACFPSPWKSNEYLLKRVSCALSLMIIYCITVTIINQIANIRSFNIYLVCLMGTEATDQNVLYNLLTVLLPIITLIFITCLLDFYSILWFRKQKTRVEPETERNSEDGDEIKCMPFIDDIPLKATMLSTIFLILVLTVYIVLGIKGIRPLEKYLIVIMITRINDTLRNPMIAICTFKINDYNRQRNADEERERNRQKEVQLALKRRQERKAQKEKSDHFQATSQLGSTQLEMRELPNVDC